MCVSELSTLRLHRMSGEGMFLDTLEDDYDRVMALNTKAPYFMAQHFARRLVATNREGVIINIASLVVNKPMTSLSVYGISKAAIDMATRSMAKELGRHKIRVNSILPGYILTEINSDFFASTDGKKMIQMMPAKRLGKLTDLDGPLLLLASDAGRGINGASLSVDDGQIFSKL